MTLKEFYTNIGGSFDVMLSRFLDENRIKKYVLMFKGDTTYQELIQNIENGQLEVAFRNIHTLKGLAANLGFDDLFKASSALTEILRNYNGQPYANELKTVRNEFEKVLTLIDQID